MISPTVLHIEPDEDDRALVERIHRRHAPPSQLVQFPSVTAARLALDGGVRPELVLVAATLDGETGIEFTLWYRDRFGGAGRIFILTGNLDPETTRQALAAGADGVIYRTADLGRMGSAFAAIFGAHLRPPQI